MLPTGSPRICSSSYASSATSWTGGGVVVSYLLGRIFRGRLIAFLGDHWNATDRWLRVFLGHYDLDLGLG